MENRWKMKKILAGLYQGILGKSIVANFKKKSSSKENVNIRKEFNDDSSKFDENGRKLSIGVENNVRKGEIACFSFSLFTRLALQAHINEGLLSVWERIKVNMRTK